MLRNITVGIDIGTHQIKVVVSELIKSENKNLTKVIGTGISQSKGLRHGYIVSIQDVVDSLREAVKKAEKNSGIKINKAYISVGGIGLSSAISSGYTIVGRADLHITDLDLEKAIQNCEENIPQNLIQNQKILHSIPISYRIDGKQVLSKSPIDMRGTKLEVKMLFVTCIEPLLNDLLQVVDEVGVDVIDVLASPIASSFVALNKVQKTSGCILVDIGAETLGVVVFENNIPVSLEVFPIGGMDITNDIALGLKISQEEAENIKNGAIVSGNHSKKKLEEIISARLTDMFELVEGHLKKIGRNGLLPAGVFISGGTAGINNIEDFAKAALKLPSRVIKLNSPDPKFNLIDPIWTVAYGLCILGFSKDDKTSVGTKYSGAKIWNKILNWIKQFSP